MRGAHRASSQQRNEELHQSNQELDDFAYIASHDLKEPLRGIHNYAGFLLEDYAEQARRRGRAKLETLMRLTRRMETLIDSLLAILPPRPRRPRHRPTSTSNEVVAEVLDSLAHLACRSAASRCASPGRCPSSAPTACASARCSAT